MSSAVSGLDHAGRRAVEGQARDVVGVGLLFQSQAFDDLLPDGPHRYRVDTLDVPTSSSAVLPMIGIGTKP